MEEQTVATADGKTGIQKSWLGILGTSLLRESLWLVHGVCQLLQGRQRGPLAGPVAPTPSSLLPRGWASQDPRMGVLMAAQAGSVPCPLAFPAAFPRILGDELCPHCLFRPLSACTQHLPCLWPCSAFSPERGAGPPRPCHTLQAPERAPNNSQHRTEASHPTRKLHPTPHRVQQLTQPCPSSSPTPSVCRAWKIFPQEEIFPRLHTERSRDEHLGEEHARLKDPAEPLPTNLGDSTQGAGSKQLCGVQPPASSAGEAAVWGWEELQAGVVTVAPFSCTLSSSKSFYNTELNHLPKQTTRPWHSSIQAESISKGSREPKPGKQMNSPACGLSLLLARCLSVTDSFQEMEKGAKRSRDHYATIRTLVPENPYPRVCVSHSHKAKPPSVFLTSKDVIIN